MPDINERNDINSLKEEGGEKHLDIRTSVYTQSRELWDLAEASTGVIKYSYGEFVQRYPNIYAGNTNGNGNDRVPHSEIWLLQA